MMDKKARNDATVVIDPVKMNIVNKVASGTKSAGSIECSGGMLLQGEHRGEMVVRNGPLILWPGSKLTGTTVVYGDAYVFGALGETEDLHACITVLGTLYLTSSAVAHGRMRYRRLATYDGAQIHGVLETIADQGGETMQPGAEVPA